MADTKHDTIDLSETPVVAPRIPLPLPLTGIALGIAGTVLMYVGFSYGIAAALDSSGNGAGGFIAVFFAGAAMALAGIVIGVVGLIRGGRRILSLLSLLIGLVPAGFVVALVVANQLAAGGPRP